MRSMRNIVPVIFVLLLVVSGCSRKHPQAITQELVSEWLPTPFGILQKCRERCKLIC